MLFLQSSGIQETGEGDGGIGRRQEGVGFGDIGGVRELGENENKQGIKTTEKQGIQTTEESDVMVDNHI